MVVDPHGPARIGLSVETTHLAEQVARLVQAAGAVVVSDDPVDARILEEGTRSLGRAGSADPPTGETRVIVVRAGDGTGRGSRDPSGEGVLALPADAEALLRRLGALRLNPRAHVVGFVGARGGAGASTLAAAVAREAVRHGASTALTDLDAAGGGLDLLLGIEHEAGPRWVDLRSERAGFPAQALSMALPRWEAVRVLSADSRGGARPADPGVVDAVQALASEHDLVVLDLPRNGPWGLDGTAAEPHALPCRSFVLVATCDLRSAAAVASAAKSLDGQQVRLVVRAPGPGGLDPEDFAEASGLPLFAVTRTERGGAAAAERGEAPGDRPRSPVGRTAARIVRDLALSS